MTSRQWISKFQPKTSILDISELERASFCKLRVVQLVELVLTRYLLLNPMPHDEFIMVTVLSLLVTGGHFEGQKR